MPACPEISQLLVSTDLSGVLRPPLDIRWLYGLAAQELGIEYALEAVCFKHQYQDLISHSTQYPQILGLHGGVGVTPGEPLQKRLEGMLFGRMLMPTAEVVSFSQEINAEYVLVHQNETLNPKTWQAYLQAPEKLILFVENHPTVGSFDRTVATVEALRRAGKPHAQMMVDILHLLAEHPQFDKRLPTPDLGVIWDWALAKIQAAAELGVIGGLHLPIGTNLDSIPRDAFFTCDSFWRQLASLTHQYPAIAHYLVIENQHEIAKGYLPPWLQSQIARENLEMFEFMAQCGLLPTGHRTYVAD